MSSEAYFERRVTAELRRKGVHAMKLNMPGQGGYPDRLYLYRSRAVFVEFKSNIGKVTPRQKAMQRILSDQGFTVYTLRPRTTVRNVVDLIMIAFQ